MKDFLKMTLAVIVGLVLVGIIGMMLCLGIVGSIAALGNAQPVLPKTGVLTIDMSRIAIGEQGRESNPLQSVSGPGQVKVVGLWDAVQAVNYAASDAAIEYIYLKTDGSSTDIANVSELRKALSNFRSSGKAVVAYMESPTTGEYYLASVADKIYMTSHPGAMPTITGISSQMTFFKDLLDRLGVNVQLIRHGKYKSAGETFVRSEPSAENLEQYQAMIDSMWGTVASEIAESRGMDAGKLNGLVDNLRLNLPADFLEAGLVDELLTREGMEEKLSTLSVVEDYKDVKKIDFADYIAARVTPSRARRKIAVIYADGEIVDGSDRKDIAGDRFASVIEKVRRDSTVKAVVLRVNSPGGAVLAADKIKNEVDLLKAVKPVVASYGSYAASGGYWISANADKIFTDAVTLTGSIGVFSIIPDLSKTLKNVARVGVTSVTSNKHGDMYSLMRPLDKDEYDYMLRSVEDIYGRFTGLVAEGRGMSVEAVDSIGQGRVWTGSDAVGIGLADEIGTLEDAIRYAAVCAGDPELTDWAVCGYPEVPGPFDQVMEMLGNAPMDDESVLVRRLGGLTEIKTLARLPYEITISR
mgnify:CR=1 FL=1